MKTLRDDFFIDYYDDNADDNDEALQLSIQISLDFEKASHYNRLERVLSESKKSDPPVVDLTHLLSFDLACIIIDMALVGKLQSWRDVVNFTNVNRYIHRECIEKLENVKSLIMTWRYLPDRYTKKLQVCGDEGSTNKVAVAYIDKSYSITRNTVIYMRIKDGYYYQRNAGAALQYGLLYSEEVRDLLDIVYEKKYEQHEQ